MAHSVARSLKTNFSSSLTIKGSVSIIRPAGSTISVFTPAEQAGNFSALCTSGFSGGICNDRTPSSTAPAGTTCAAGSTSANCVVTNQLYNPCAAGTGIGGYLHPVGSRKRRVRSFPNNMIPASMISPVAAALFASSLYPKTINNNLTSNAMQEISNQLQRRPGRY